MDHAQLLAPVFELARRDDSVRGLVLTGSAARGMATVHSDLDVLVVLSENVDGWHTTRTPELDTIYVTMEELADIPESPGEWYERWSCAYADVLLDKGGVEALVDAQATLSPVEVGRCLEHYLDAYINWAYRSLKSARDGRPLEQRLDAAESLRPLLWCVFAFVGRVRPYNKYLAWELRTHPLIDPLWSRLPLLDLVTSILDSGDPTAQRAIFAAVERSAREHGFGETIDAWGAELTLLRGR